MKFKEPYMESYYMYYTENCFWPAPRIHLLFSLQYVFGGLSESVHLDWPHFGKMDVASVIQVFPLAMDMGCFQLYTIRNNTLSCPDLA